MVLHMRVMVIAGVAAVVGVDVVSAGTGGETATLFDAYNKLEFRNPTYNNVARKNDGVTHVPQCVLYSEIDNVSSINKGWDVGSGVGWQLGYPYLANGSVPPTGIRSAVPLGGMGTGNFELRADGTFRQWCIESQSPGGGAKLDIGALDDAILAVRLDRGGGATPTVAALRTTPPDGIDGVEAMRYEGAVPLSKLTPLDPGLAGIALYAHGEMAPWDTNGSMTPAVAFTLTVSNPDATPLTASLLLSLPLATQPETGRAGQPDRMVPTATTVSACKAVCDADAVCRGWIFTAATIVCGLFDKGVPQNIYATGVSSGIKGVWSASSTSLIHSRVGAPSPPRNGTGACLAATPAVGVDIDVGTVDTIFSVAVGPPGIAECQSKCCNDPTCSAWVVADATAPAGATPPPCTHGIPCCWHKSGRISERPACTFCTSGLGSYGGGGGGGGGRLDEQVGDFSLYVPPSSNGVRPSFYVADTLPELFNVFASGAASTIDPAHPSSSGTHGGVAATVVVPPHENATITVIFAWRFAERYFTGKSIGNYYAVLHPSATAAAEGLASRLAQTVDLIHGVHSAFFDAKTMPEFLQDTLVNSMSQWRSAFMTRDGRWRQWEAYDCVDVDSVHNDYQRHVPYAVFYPDLIKNTMETGWSKLQQSNGMIVESLSGGCMGATGTLDGGGGRVMGDVSTIFIIEALEMFEYTHDVEWLARIYPTITRAIDWFVDVGTDGSALPKRQCCTYDIIDFADYDHTSFNSFVYLAALRACVRLANIQNDSTLATKCNTAYAAGEVAIDASLWNATSGYYRAWTDASLGAPPWVMADTLYGQVIANYLNLGDNGDRNSTWLVPPEMVASHLKVEAEFNPSPYGLTVVTMSGVPPSDMDKQYNNVSGTKQQHAADESCTAAVKESKYNSVWMGGAPDWAALQIALGDDGVGVDIAMAMAKKELDHYRTTLRDQWNIHGLTANDGYGVDGQPWCTAHYGFHMPLWFIPFAMSKQSFKVVNSAHQSELAFDPVVPCPYTLSVLATGAVGLLTCAQVSPIQQSFNLAITAGSLDLTSLRVGQTAYPGGAPGRADPQSSLTWST